MVYLLYICLSVRLSIHPSVFVAVLSLFCVRHCIVSGDTTSSATHMRLAVLCSCRMQLPISDEWQLQHLRDMLPASPPIDFIWLSRTVYCCNVYHSHKYTHMSSSYRCTRTGWFGFSLGFLCFSYLGPVCLFCVSGTYYLLFILSCQCQWKWLPGKTRLRNDLLMCWAARKTQLSHSLTRFGDTSKCKYLLQCQCR